MKASTLLAVDTGDPIGVEPGVGAELGVTGGVPGEGGESWLTSVPPDSELEQV